MLHIFSASHPNTNISVPIANLYICKFHTNWIYDGLTLLYSKSMSIRRETSIFTGTCKVCGNTCKVGENRHFFDRLIFDLKYIFKIFLQRCDFLNFILSRPFTFLKRIQFLSRFYRSNWKITISIKILIVWSNVNPPRRVHLKVINYS